ncbi:MAG: hypothetical protein ABL962_06620 [Fimbriimonadaceae bacterium]
MQAKVLVLEREMISALEDGERVGAVFAFVTDDMLCNVAALRVCLLHPELIQIEHIELVVDPWAGGGWMHGRGWILASSNGFLKDFLALEEVQVKYILSLIAEIGRSHHEIHKKAQFALEYAIVFLEEYLHKVFGSTIKTVQ